MPNHQLDASIIILGYNGLDYVNDCIEAVLDQDFPEENYEVIWADNASVDGSPDCVKSKFPSVRLIRFDTNYGFAEGNNRAAKEARARYLVFLNQDTIVHRSWLRVLVETLDSHDDLAACQANIFMPWHVGFDSFDRVGYPELVHYQDIDQYGFYTYRERPMQDTAIPCDGLAGASFIIDRRIVEGMPYIFDPLFISFSEDLDLALRLKAQGYRVAVAPRAVLYHLQYSSMSNLRSAFRKAYLSVRNRMLAHYKVMPTHRFIMSLPNFLLGAMLKMKEFRFGRWRELSTMVAMVPVFAAAFLGAIRLMPRYRGHRKKMELSGEQHASDHKLTV